MVKPTALKILEGTGRKDRVNPREPTPERGIPIAPKHLAPSAKKIWNELCQLLDEIGVLTLADVFALEGAAQSLAELRAARAALKARASNTYCTTSRDGSVMHRTYPEVQAIADLDRRVLAWLGKLGLTPCDRAKVSATEAETGNAFADL